MSKNNQKKATKTKKVAIKSNQKTMTGEKDNVIVEETITTTNDINAEEIDSMENTNPETDMETPETETNNTVEEKKPETIEVKVESQPKPIPTRNPYRYSYNGLCYY